MNLLLEEKNRKKECCYFIRSVSRRVVKGICEFALAVVKLFEENQWLKCARCSVLAAETYGQQKQRSGKRHRARTGACLAALSPGGLVLIKQPSSEMCLAHLKVPPWVFIELEWLHSAAAKKNTVLWGCWACYLLTFIEILILWTHEHKKSHPLCTEVNRAACMRNSHATHVNAGLRDWSEHQKHLFTAAGIEHTCIWDVGKLTLPLAASPAPADAQSCWAAPRRRTL